MTYSKSSAEQRITLPKIDLQCIPKYNKKSGENTLIFMCLR